MPFGKFAAIAAAVLLAPVALMIAFGGGEPAAPLADPPAAVPRPERSNAIGAMAGQGGQPKQTDTASSVPRTAEPKAAFSQPAAKEKPQPASPKVVPVHYQGAAGDRDCADFASQAEAQRFFLANGGPGSDPHRLDRDHDGVACESN
jgi:hypothetical protein